MIKGISKFAYYFNSRPYNVGGNNSSSSRGGRGGVNRGLDPRSRRNAAAAHRTRCSRRTTAVAHRPRTRRTVAVAHRPRSRRTAAAVHRTRRSRQTAAAVRRTRTRRTKHRVRVKAAMGGPLVVSCQVALWSGAMLWAAAAEAVAGRALPLIIPGWASRIRSPLSDSPLDPL